MEDITMERTNETHVTTRQYNKNSRSEIAEARERWQSQAGERESRGLTRQLETGSIIQTLGATGALVLGILGIIGIASMVFDSIASIAAGGALLIGGAALTARYSRLFPDTKSPKTKKAMLRGLTYQTIVGLGGIALGILALLGLSSQTLIGASVIALGSALLVASRASTRLDSLLIRNELESGESVSHNTVGAVSAGEVVCGLGAMALGVLALSGVSPMALTLIAMIGIGTAAVAGGTWLVGVVFNVYHAPAFVED